MTYNWQQPDWPDFRYDLAAVEPDLLRYAEQAGQVRGLLQGLPESAQNDALVEFMIAEAMKSSAIEGEVLSRPDVKSSVRHRLGLDDAPSARIDDASAGAAELMVKVREHWDASLDAPMLWDWHRVLMTGNTMQVISGAVGKERLHFEAPPSAQVPVEMERFTQWFNASRTTIVAGPVRAALAHLYFESIHPFEDGNGRLGRALAEKALSQNLGRPATSKRIAVSITMPSSRRSDPIKSPRG